MTSLLQRLPTWEDRAQAMERAAEMYAENGERHKAEAALLSAKTMRMLDREGVPLDDD